MVIRGPVRKQVVILVCIFSAAARLRRETPLVIRAPYKALSCREAHAGETVEVLVTGTGDFITDREVAVRVLVVFVSSIHGFTNVSIGGPARIK